LQGNITIANSPGVVGLLTGYMYYDYTNKYMKILYNLNGPGSPIEVIQYTPVRNPQ
jgi:hypothetical protein